MSRIPESGDEGDPRDRVLRAAERIIATDGVEAATTRAVAAAAGVQAPTLYRLFGDKDGLLDAVVDRAMASHVARKSERTPADDPIAELRAGWDVHVGFGLENPEIFAVAAVRYAQRREGAAMQRGLDLLRVRIGRLAAAGRLRMPETRALDLMQAAATGIVLALLRHPPEIRDMALSREAREATISTISGEAAEGVADGPLGAAMALRSQLPGVAQLSDGERLLLSELLDRIAGGASPTDR